MTAPEPEVIAELRWWHREGCDDLFTIGEVLAVEIGDILAAYDALATRCAAAEEERALDKTFLRSMAEQVEYTTKLLSAAEADLTAARAQVAANLCVSCSLCNRRKNAKMPEAFSGQGELSFAA